MPERTTTTCRCGHGRDHYMVSAEPKYGLWKIFVVSMGISQVPERVEYRCRRCNEVFDVSDDVTAHAG